MTALTDRPARLLLRLHLRQMSGLLRLTGRGLDARVWVRAGVLWAAEGVPELFVSLGDKLPRGVDPGDHLLPAIPSLMGTGLDLNSIMDAAGRGVGRLLAQASLDPDLQAEFEPEVDPPAGAFAASTPLLRDFALALRELQSAGEVADELAGWSSSRLRVEQAAGQDLSPLGPIAVRTLALARRNRILGDLVRNSGRGQLKRTQEAWLAVNLLRQLGLVRIHDAPPVTKAATLKGLSPPTGEQEPAPQPPLPERPRRPQPMRPPPSRRRTSTQARPTGLAAFADPTDESEETPLVEVEEQRGPRSTPAQAELAPPSLEDFEEDEGGTEPLLAMLGEEEATGPLNTADLEEAGIFAMGEDEDEGDDDSGELFAMGDEDDEVFAMADEDDEEVFAMADEDDSGQLFAMGDEDDEEVFAMADDDEEDDEEDEPRDVTNPVVMGADEEEEVVVAMGAADEEGDDWVTGKLQAETWLAEESEPDEESVESPGKEDLRGVVAEIGDLESAGDPASDEADDAWEEDGFSLDDDTPEDPALPGLRRRLETLQAQTPFQRLGVGPRTLLSRNLKRSELEFCWQTARAPWLPANWRSASPPVQDIVGEIRGVLDLSYRSLNSPEDYARGLSHFWSSLPQRQSRTADALVKRAQRECAGAQWDQALAVLKKARQANPTHARAVLLQTYAQVVQDKLPPEDAIAWVYAVSQHQSDLKLRAQGAYTAGRIMERLRRPADALICYRTAAQWQPEHKPSIKRLRALKDKAQGTPSPLARCFDPRKTR